MACLFTLCFQVLAKAVENNGPLDLWEDRVLLSLHAMRGAQWSRVMSAVDWLHGPVLAGWVLGGSALWCFRKRWGQLALMYSIVLGGGFVARVAKLMVARDRPEVERLLGASGFSFPSGHTIGVALFAAWVIYVVLNSRLSMRLRWLCASAAVGLALAVAASRVYMGVHYPSDVLGSILAGAAWSCACIAAYTWLAHRRLSRSEQDA